MLLVGKNVFLVIEFIYILNKIFYNEIGFKREK